LDENDFKKYLYNILNSDQDNLFLEKEDIKFQRKIAVGGFASVYKAKFKGITVAVKVINFPKLSNQTWEEFLKEVKLLKRLRHPNIVNIFYYKINILVSIMTMNFIYL
jgi:serine/threonine protein kinase